MDVKVFTKNGKMFEMNVKNGDIETITKKLNKAKFVYFGPLIINTNEIEWIEKVAE